MSDLLLDRFARAAMHFDGYRSERVPTPMGYAHSLVYEGLGELPPLTIVHGFAAAGVHQALTALPLRRRVRRVVLPDLLGHGFSEAPDPLTPDHVHAGLTMALEALQPEPMVIVASSFGGWAAARFASQNPERVRGMVLVSPLGAPMPYEQRAPLLEMLRAREVAHACQFLDRATGRPRRRNRVFARRMQRMLSRRPIQDLVERAFTVPLLTPTDLERIDVPVKLVWGRHEAIFPESQLTFWRQLPQVEVLRPERSAHSPAVEQPRWFHRVVRSHLEQCADSTLDG